MTRRGCKGYIAYKTGWMNNGKTDLGAYDNSWYRPGSVLKRFFWYYINEVFLRTSVFPFYRLKVFLLLMFGAKVGKGVLIKPRVNIKYPWKLEIGDQVWIGEEVWIDNLDKVVIGNNVCISQGALLLCGNHDYTSRSFDLVVKPIIIEEGAWIGAKAIVAGGSVCGSHCVLSAGSVGSGVLDGYSVYRGNPAVKVKERVIKG